MRNKWFFVAFMVILALALAACGGGNNADSGAAADQPAAAAPATEAPATEAPAAEAQAVAAGDAAKGKELFSTTCAACHGPGGEGVQGLGKDMTHSEFIAGLDDAELMAFIKQGRPISDPLNTTGVDMPPKGGNPALNDEQLVDIIAFIREIHQ